MSNDKAEPRCPSCSVQGTHNLVSAESEERSKGRDPWFFVVHCKMCGHIYGVFPKHVFTQSTGPRLVLSRD